MRLVFSRTRRPKQMHLTCLGDDNLLCILSSYLAIIYSTEHEDCGYSYLRHPQELLAERYEEATRTNMWLSSLVPTYAFCLLTVLISIQVVARVLLRIRTTTYSVPIFLLISINHQIIIIILSAFLGCPLTGTITCAPQPSQDSARSPPSPGGSPIIWSLFNIQATLIYYYSPIFIFPLFATWSHAGFPLHRIPRAPHAPSPTRSRPPSARWLEF